MRQKVQLTFIIDIILKKKIEIYFLEGSNLVIPLWTWCRKIKKSKGTSGFEPGASRSAVECYIPMKGKGGLVHIYG